MQVLLTDIINAIKADILNVFGKPEGIMIAYLKSPENVDELTLDWINPNKADKQRIAEDSMARALLTDTSVTYTQELKDQKKVLIICENPKLAIANAGNVFFVPKYQPGIHPTATIDPKAQIGKNVFIGASACIGNCTIGDNATIYANVVINDKVIVGQNVVIKPGAVLGFDGFGFEKDKNGSLVKFPQLGSLIIENNVEIGSNTCIDKGSLSNTIIGEGTKINNLCHIAHNVVTGKNVIITAQVNVSGSTIIEDNVWIAPNASLRGHQRIGKGAVIGMAAVVTKDVPPGETWVGNPAHKLVK